MGYLGNWRSNPTLSFQLPFLAKKLLFCHFLVYTVQIIGGLGFLFLSIHHLFDLGLFILSQLLLINFLLFQRQRFVKSTKYVKKKFRGNELIEYKA